MTAKIKLNAASGGGSVSLEAPTSTTSNANVELKLPVADGSSSQVLTTNGSGQLAFASVSGTTINNNADNRVITGSGTANTLEGEASLLFDGGILKVDDTGGTAGKGRLEFGNSGEQFIEGFDTGNGGSSSYLRFGYGSTEALRINNTGGLEHVSVNNTAYTVSIAGAIRFQVVHSGGGNMVLSNPSSGNVTYSTSSDYRLKENASTINNALTTVKALKPYQFTWKHDSKIGQGFFAHEVLETTPNSQAALGTKDAVDLEGNPIYQQVDYSKLVPLLTAALQEATAKIEVLETKVAALEAA